MPRHTTPRHARPLSLQRPTTSSPSHTKALCASDSPLTPHDEVGGRSLCCIYVHTPTPCGGEVWHGITSGVSRETCTKKWHRRSGATWCYIGRLARDFFKQTCKTSPPQDVHHATRGSKRRWRATRPAR